jgi:V/A-type H+-transporting ATPase subunit K
MGIIFALAGAAMATILAGIGSAKGVGSAAETAMGVMREDSSKFGKMMILSLLPGTQGLYGFIVTFLVFIKCNILGGGLDISTATGIQFFVASMPIAFGGLFSAIAQGKTAVSGISLVAKDDKSFGKAMVQIALVEFYALLAFIVSLLAVVNVPV